jgi:DNA (cytosine-5)-methyltransferase 1
VSTFSGIGGIDLGLERAGMTTVAQIEINQFCTRVLERRWPHVRRFGDIRGFGAHSLLVADGRGPERQQLPGEEPDVDRAPRPVRGRALDDEGGRGDDPARVDVLTGGFPCQDVSVAGRRAGLAGARTGLFWEFLRVARELRPSWVLLENVPGLLSSNDGRDFAVVLSALAGLGYGVAWRVLDSRYFGVAQRRRRVFVVGRLGAPCPPEVLFEPAGCAGDPQAGDLEGADVAGTLGGGAPGDRGRRDDLDSSGAYVADEVAYALNASHGTHIGQGHSTTYVPEDPDVAHALRARPNASHRADSDTYVARPLTSSMGKHHDEDTDTLVAIQDARTGSKGQHGLGVSEGDVMFTLDQQSRHAIAHTLRAEGSDASEDGTGRGVPMVVTPPVAAPLTSGSHPNSNAPSRHREDDENLVAVTSGPKMWDDRGIHRGGVSETVTPTLSSYEQPMMIEPGVRRLTPVECERLQGFPDHWTAWLEERGTPDGEGLYVPRWSGRVKPNRHDRRRGVERMRAKARGLRQLRMAGWRIVAGTPDGPRYAALGNAVTVPVAEWIGRRIAAAHAAPASPPMP